MAIIWADGETTETPDRCPKCKHVIECSTVITDRLATPARFCNGTTNELKLVMAPEPIPVEVAVIRQQMRLAKSQLS